MTMPHPAAARLRAHVQMLAGTIGERNLWRYDALDRAARYISSQFSSGGYAAEWQTFDVAKIPSAMSRRADGGRARGGDRRRRRPLRHGRPAARARTTTAPAWPRCWSWRSGSPAGRSRARSASWRSSTKSRRSSNRAHGQRRLCERGEGRGDESRRCWRWRRWATTRTRKGASSTRRRSHRGTRTSGDFIGFVANSASARLLLQSRRAFGGGRNFRSRPWRPLTTSPASAGRITGRSGRRATRR